MKVYRRNKYISVNKRVLAVFYPGAKSEWSTISYIRQLKNHTDNDIELHLLFVIPTISAYYYQTKGTCEVAEQQKRDAEATLKQLARLFSVPADRQWLATGNVIAESHWLAQHLDVDEIVGSSKLLKLRGYLQKFISFIANGHADRLKYKKNRLISAQ